MESTSSSERTIFLKALECASPEDRNAYLDEACGDDQALRAEVESLLRVHETSGDLLSQVDGQDTTCFEQPASWVGRQIGPYFIREQLGEGGMGVVYAAEQKTPVRRKVALKLIKPGMDSRQVIARFEAERQALALMDHPGVARVYDAGTTKTGFPYFVMELVNGLPITKYCDRYRLSNVERLQLFTQVCGAVQHAHLKGIIHRDIKPGNILVTQIDGKPVPKVIDFGVAKATNQQLTDKTIYTHLVQVLGTPLYISPEQAELSGVDVDTRTDVYSLGVVLYELLSGCTPFDREVIAKAGLDEMRRMIRESEPPRPSLKLSTLNAECLTTIAESRQSEPVKLSQTLRGELDWIVMKSMEKDRNRRYESASQLADDVGRYLNDEPVEACPPTVTYRLKTFVKRNRSLVATGAAVFAALNLGLILAVWQAYVASHESSRAAKAELEAKAKQAEAIAQAEQAAKNLKLAMTAVNEMYSEASETMLRITPESQAFRKRILERALAFYHVFLEENSNPNFRFETAIAWRRVGEIYHRFEQNDKAIEALQNAIDMLQDLAEANPTNVNYRRELGATYRFLAKPYEVTQRLSNGIKCCRAALEIEHQLLHDVPHDPDSKVAIARSYHQLGHVSTDTSEATHAFRSAIELVQRLREDDPGNASLSRQMAHDLSHLGKLLFDGGNIAEAETAYRGAIKVIAGAENTPHADVLDSYQDISAGLLRNFGVLLRETDRLGEAEKTHYASVEKVWVLAESFPSVAYYQGQLALSNIEYGRTLMIAGKVREAVEQFENADRIYMQLREKFPENQAYRLQQQEAWVERRNALE